MSSEVEGELSRWQKSALIGVAVVWFGVQVALGHRFIFHDSWRYIFPIVYRVAQDTTCLGLHGG